MKTMKKDNDIRRVYEKDVDIYLKKGYNFTNKQEWKTKIRDVEEKNEKQSDKGVEKKKKKEKKNK